MERHSRRRLPHDTTLRWPRQRAAPWSRANRASLGENSMPTDHHHSPTPRSRIEVLLQDPRAFRFFCTSIQAGPEQLVSVIPVHLFVHHGRGGRCILWLGAPVCETLAISVPRLPGNGGRVRRQMTGWYAARSQEWCLSRPRPIALH